MLPSLASVEELADRLPQGETLASPDERHRAQAALNDASALIRSEAGLNWLDTEDETELSADLPDVVVATCLAVAYRAYRNPDGTTQTSVGDVSVSFSREGVAGSVFLTKAEQRAVRSAAGRSAYGSIQMVTPFMGNTSDIYYYAPVEEGDSIPLGPLPWEHW